MGEGMAGARFASRMDLEQFGGDIADLFLGLASRALPQVAAEASQWYLLGIDARVAIHHVERRHRHEQLRSLGIFDAEEFGALPVHIERLQSEVAPDTVLDMHHRHADVELREIADRGLPGLSRARPTPALQHASPEQRGFRHHRQCRIVQHETIAKRRDDQGATCAAADECVPAIERLHGGAGSRQQLVQHLAPPRRIGAEQDAWHIEAEDLRHPRQRFLHGTTRRLGER